MSDYKSLTKQIQQTTEALKGGPGSGPRPGGGSGGSDDRAGSKGTPSFDVVKKASGGNEGYAYVIHATLKDIVENDADQDEAFAKNAEDQNYHGDRADIKQDRENMASILRNKFDIDIENPHRV